MKITTLRIIDRSRNLLGEWFCEPNDTKRLTYVKSELAAAIAEEPNAGWKLQTRGTQSDWHDFVS